MVVVGGMNHPNCVYLLVRVTLSALGCYPITGIKSSNINLQCHESCPFLEGLCKKMLEMVFSRVSVDI